MKNVLFRAPVSQSPCHGASQQHHTEEPCVALPSKVISPCSVPCASAISSPYPPLAAQHLCAELWGRLMQQHRSKTELPSLGSRSDCKAQRVGSCPSQPSLYLKQSLLYSEGSSLRGCVSLDKVQSAKGPWVKYTCAAVILTHCWITEFAPKFLTWRSKEVCKSCWCTVGSTQKNSAMNKLKGLSYALVE